MRYASYMSAVVVAILSLAGSPASVSASERPFLLQGSGQLNVDATGAGTFTASGQATYLGHWTNEGTIQFAPGANPGTLSAEGEVVFTAANGDELYATIEGVLDLTTGVAGATFTIVGGTGRFASAGGKADSVILQSPDGSFTFSMEGTIEK